MMGVLVRVGRVTLPVGGRYVRAKKHAYLLSTFSLRTLFLRR